MRDDTRSVIWAATLVIIVGIISVPWAISYYCTTFTQSLIEAGYEQQTLPGESGVYWVKTDDR